MKNFARLRKDSPFYDLFEDGLVAIHNIIVPNEVVLEGSDETTVYMVDLEKCGPARVHEISERLAAQSGVRADVIFEELMRVGLPLRASQTETVSTDVPF